MRNAGAATSGCAYRRPVFGRGASREPEDHSVAPAEAILDRVATRASLDGSRTHAVAVHALWICACVSMDDAPTWLIYDETDGTLRWCRVPGGLKASDIVDARFTAGGHADPAGVLAWLRGDVPDPWARGGGWGDESVVRELGNKLAPRR